MAIGDSLYNGMRSATITQPFAAHSVPALVARALGVQDFRSPDYPRPVLLDVEEAMRSRLDGFPPAGLAYLAAHIKDILDGARDNGRAWFNDIFGGFRAADPPRVFDNLAVAGALVDDMFVRDVAWRIHQLDGMKAIVRSVNSPFEWKADGWDVTDVHIAINAKFTLDPRNDPALLAMRPIDFVNLRRPQTLLVSLGHNHGLIDITLRGEVEKAHTNLEAMLDGSWRHAAEMLAALDCSIGMVCINKMPLPSQVPNMMPPEIQPGELPRLPPGKDFFDKYENRLGDPSRPVTFTGDQMRELNGYIGSVNQRMEQIARSAAGRNADRLRFFDVPQMFDCYDGKHHPGKGVLVTAEHAGDHHDHRYTNEAVDLTNDILRPWPQRLVGGLGSLDNHHPSTMGYTAIAMHLVKYLWPNLTPPELTDREDAMIQRMPRNFIWAMRLLYLIRLGDRFVSQVTTFTNHLSSEHQNRIRDFVNNLQVLIAGHA
jgi:hypothetical protein